VTVKHRIGIDKTESYAFVRDFVGTVAQAGCEVFIVHARNAWLKGLSPKENRELPPLRYETSTGSSAISRSSRSCSTAASRPTTQIAEHLAHVDGVMLGREAYHHPWLMADWDAALLRRRALGPRTRRDRGPHGRVHAARGGRR
jgi:tRNA-dihydrouridine synthase A